MAGRVSELAARHRLRVPAITRTILRELQRDGVTSWSGIARAFKDRRIPAARGGNNWTATQVARVEARLTV
jgi:hypothetical protein